MEYLHTKGFSKLDAPKQWVEVLWVEEVWRGVIGYIMCNAWSPHLIDVLVTAVSWLSIVIVGGGVSSLLREEKC